VRVLAVSQQLQFVDYELRDDKLLGNKTGVDDLDNPAVNQAATIDDEFGLLAVKPFNF
jgi:hypothetical protein